MRQTKQSVELKYATPLWLIADAIRYSRDNHYLSDSLPILKRLGKNVENLKCPLCSSEMIICATTNSKHLNCTACGHIIRKCEHIGPKDYNLIKRVGFHMHHDSTLEHSKIVFDVKMAQKALLEESRHRIGVSQTVTSSRYALDIMGVEFEPTRKDDINAVMEDYRQEIIKLIELYKDETGKVPKEAMDDLAMMLPQAFIYKMQLTFNMRSLIHFLELRVSPAAHYTIRGIAIQMIKALPLEWKHLILENKIIKKNYEKVSNKI
jgi:flavin-dependent thymidylate synthase